MASEKDKDLHFLVVDDDENSRSTILEYLKTLGYGKVTLARDGAEAVRILDRDGTINFVISDWDMPLMNGLAFLQRVRSNPMRSHLPFLIATSPVSEEAEKIVLAAENLVDSYIIKPFRAQVLQEKIEQMLQLSVHGPQKLALVVDDDADAREMIIEYLKSLGFRDVHGVSDGRAALNYLIQNPGKVGLIVSDWEMPEMSGIDLLRACKVQQSLAEIPFLMVTSQSSMERMKVMQAAKAQVDQYLLKPFTNAELKKRIDQLLEKARCRREVEETIQDATMHLEAGRYQRAETLFEEVLKMDPDHDAALRGLGDALIKSKGVESALPHYKKAVEANPLNTRGYLKLASAYEQIGWLDKAIALLKLGNQQINFSAELHFHLGRLYNKKGMTALAKAEFEKTLKIQLDHQEARLMLEMLVGNRSR